MKLPIRIKETLYYDTQTGKPIGSEYWVFDDAAEELFVINDDEDAARFIVASVNACKGLSTNALEAAAQEGILLDFTRPTMKNEPNDFTGAERFQPLFNLLEEKFGIVSLQSEMDEIADACKPLYQPAIDRLMKQNAELVEALAQLLDTCPCDPDTTKDFQQANEFARATLANNQQANPADLDDL